MGTRRKKRKRVKRHNPIAVLLRRFRPQAKPSARLYSRKGRRRQADEA